MIFPLIVYLHIYLHIYLRIYLHVYCITFKANVLVCHTLPTTCTL